MIREILKYPDARLAVECTEVCEITEEIRQLAEDMAETMYKEEGIGLAAPQVGEHCRLIVVDVTGPEERKGLMKLVNPRLVNHEGEVETEEGCLSVLNYRSKVKRAEKVRLLAKDVDGKEVCMDADGLLAICLQHEIDHLDGTLFIDKISRLKRTMYDGKVKKWLRK
ncbi:peptide deformylase [Desulfovibrio psychrotolerans]|uniref:Peptide deformylase n=1 Tax=Desulfovibrio psychrotolerans TaxID=415242 RepID=A0A7J0BXU5_9BACT|nr:peptide deformylase [Desulfovibrio psychrotolerans]GFM38526.1 peptide deformylase [Desulfovibrio psychrotolerans]